MRSLFRAAAAVMAGTLVLFLAACGGEGTESGGGADSTSIKIGLNAEPENLDFSTTDGAAIPEALLVNVYEGLVKLDEEGEIVPLLAKSWKLSKDRKTYTFQLQEGAKFSNGDPFDADAVKFSIERVKSDAWKISLKDYMDVVSKVQVVSPTEVKVVLKKPSNNWLFQMTTRIGAMYSPDGVSDLATKPIGTGPYDAQALDARRLDPARPEPRLLGQEAGDEGGDAASYFKDATALNNALLSGEIDVINDIQAPDSLSQFTDDDRFQVLEGTTNGEITMALNNGSGPMKDKRIRQAVSMGLDREAILKTAWAGRGEVIGSMVPPTDPWYEDLTGVQPYDPEKAKALLAEAGATDLKLRFRVPNLPYATAPAQVVKSQLAKIGVTATIDVLEFPARWLSEVFTKADYDMSIVQHVEPRDIVTFGNPDYYWRYDSPEVQKLLASADEGTEAQQTADLKKVARKLAEDAAAIWLYVFPNITVADAEIKGLPKNRVSESLDLTTITRG